MMKIKAVMIDDDLEYANDMKNRLEQLDESFFLKHCNNIIGIEIFVAQNKPDAIKLLTEEKPNIFIIDIELKDVEKGHDFYETLFVKGITVPSIAVSAVVKTKEFEKDIKSKGISEIVHKMVGEGDAADRIISSICRVLDSNNLDQLKTAVENYNIGNISIDTPDGSKSINELINDLKNGKFNHETANQIYSEIRNKCIEQDEFH